MKTSNKLLLGLLVAIMLVPVVMILSFKSAIKANRYSLKNMSGSNVTAFKNLKPFKAIRLDGISGNNILRCTIKYGDNYQYRFNNYNPEQYEEGRSDSCSIHIIDDTLFIAYKPKMNETLKPINYYYGIDLQLTVPGDIVAYANQATLNIDSSSGRQSAMEFTLFNNAVLNITGAAPVIKTIAEGDSLFRDLIVPQTVFSKMKIDATSSAVNIDNAAFTDLQLVTKGQSALKIPGAIAADTLNGQLSPETTVNAPYSFIKNLQ